MIQQKFKDLKKEFVEIINHKISKINKNND
jgi:hypothetical protein